MKLRLIVRDRRPKVLSRASSWVAFCGCSLEHTSGGCQCWGSIAKGYRTPTRREVKCSTETENGTESEGNSSLSVLP
jgi:hypothetical protein